MNSTVRINVRATFGDAQKQFATMIAEVDKLDAATKRASAGGMTQMDKALERNGLALSAWGKKLQYNGSILTYNFTVPLTLAFGALMKQELDYQRSLASLEQVYKRVGASVTDVAGNNRALAADFKALDGIVIALSSHYGVSRTEVANMATELGRAGSQGVQLAKDTESALIVLRSFNLTSTDAVGVLTTLRASYHLTSDEARQALGVMAVSNESTRGSFDLLAQGLIRAAPVATQLGVPIRNLVALLSTMNQAGFKGGESGNALSAGLQRLVVITPKANDVLHRLGIEARSAAFQSLNGADRIQLLADKLKGASGDLVAYAASVIFGVQRSKQFDAVLADLSNRHGIYHGILDATTDKTKVLATQMRFLGIQMDNPAVKLDILKETAKNNARVIAQDLLPALSFLMNIVVALTGAFSHLKTPQQEFIIFGLLTLALIGPIMKVIGAFSLLGGYAQGALLKVIGWMGYVTEAQRTQATEALILQEAEATKSVQIATAKYEKLALEQQLFYAKMDTAMLTFIAAEAEGNAILMAQTAGTVTQMELMEESMVAKLDASYVAMTTATAEAAAAGAAATEAAFPPLLGIAIVLGLIIAVVYKFRDQFLRAFENIAEGLGYIVAEIAAALSWLNPFARHSPSLVERVTDGTALISGKYAQMARDVSGSTGQVAGAIQALNNAVSNSGNPGIKYSILGGQKQVQKHGNAEQISAYSGGVAALATLNAEADAASDAMNKQTRVVQAAKDAYDDAGLKIKTATLALKDLEAQQKDLQAAQKALGDPNALRSQATAASNMGRALLAAGNPELAAQFGAQADKLNAQAASAQKSKDQMDKLSKQIDDQKDAIQKLTDARDALLATYDAEKEKLQAIKNNYADIKQQISDITALLGQLAQASAAANAAGKTPKGKKPKDPGGLAAGFAGASGSTLPGFDVGQLSNPDKGGLDKYLADLKGRFGKAMGDFPNPIGGITDFIGKLKKAFMKGWDEFQQGAFDKVFGFGKGLPKWMTDGFAAGFGVVGILLLGLLVKALKYLFSGSILTDLFKFGAAMMFNVGAGAESASLATRIGLIMRGVSAALLSNPIGIIILALIAFGIGMEVLWKKSETFRDVISLNLSLIKTAFLTFGDIILGVFIAVTKGLLTFVGDNLDLMAKALGWVPGIGPKLKEAAKAFDGFKNDTVKSLTDMKDGLRQQLEESEKKTKLQAALLGEAMSTPVKDRLPFYQGIAKAYGMSLPDVLDAARLPTKDKSMLLARQVEDAMAGQITATYNAAKHLGSSGAAGIADNLAAVQRASDSLARTPHAAFMPLAAEAYRDGFAIGSNLALSMEDAMRIHNSGVQASAADLVRGANTSAKAMGIIHSPSKAFMWIGQMLAEGLSLGLTNGHEHVARAGGATAKAAMDAMQRSITEQAGNMQLPLLTQDVKLNYLGGTTPKGGVAGPGTGGDQHIHINMADSPTTADPHQVAQALAWKMRMAASY